MTPSPDPLLVVEGLDKTFTLHLHGGARLPVVTRVAFSVSRGECVVLAGPSGAGKSSILKMAYGAYRADAGSILLADAGRFIDIAQFLASRPTHLISLMDHTPGQRQFRDLEKYFDFHGGKLGRGREEIEALARERRKVGAARALVNRPRIVAIAKARGIVLASHDDTTVDEVMHAHADGVTIAEFPTTLEAAAASRAVGMATVMGAPNVVRGGSHSGNAAARDLADAGHLDILSSDYVPAALLMAAFRLAETPAVGGLPGAIRLVSKAPAEATGLNDRGDIAVGRRADLLRVGLHDGEPVVRAVWREGRRVA
jgi:alpha-D-ribose 1-methylphosphonate 5-triphosphate diphosphatase